MNYEPASDQIDFVKNSLSTDRWTHTKNVMDLSRRLCDEYDQLKPEPLCLSALFHDNARELKRKKQQKLAEQYHGKLDEIEQNTPNLWHAPAGAQRITCRFDFDVNDKIVFASAYHTTGHPKLSNILKGLLIADFAEPDRSYPEAETVRKRIGQESLTNLAQSVLVEKIKNCLHSNQQIHPRSVRTFNELCD